MVSPSTNVLSINIYHELWGRDIIGNVVLGDTFGIFVYYCTFLLHFILQYCKWLI